MIGSEEIKRITDEALKETLEHGKKELKSINKKTAFRFFEGALGTTMLCALAYYTPVTKLGSGIQVVASAYWGAVVFKDALHVKALGEIKTKINEALNQAKEFKSRFDSGELGVPIVVKDGEEVEIKEDLVH